MALTGASAMLSPAFAQDGGSIFDMFSRNRVLREANPEGASAAAQQMIQTTEPILSYDTANNLQMAIRAIRALRRQWRVGADPARRLWAEARQ
jgi:hypothetical protein